MCYKPSLLTYDFLKVGQSHPDLSINRKHQVGERIVRQMSWVPGWSGEHVRSSHGADFWFGIKDLLIPKGLLSQHLIKMILPLLFGICLIECSPLISVRTIQQRPPIGLKGN